MGFTKEQKVKCVESGGGYSSRPETAVVKGEIYTVEKEWKDGMVSIEERDCRFFTSRFEAYEAPVEIDWTKPLETVEGVPVKLISLERRHEFFPVIAYIGDETEAAYYTKAGKFHIARKSKNDLRNAIPKPLQTKHTVYFNLYEENGKLVTYNPHYSLAKAEDHAQGNCVGRKKIVLTLTKGEFDE